MGDLKITLVRSTCDRRRNQQHTARSLGLTRIRKSVIHRDTPQVRGMIRAIRHLVEVEELPSQGGEG